MGAEASKDKDDKDSDFLGGRCCMWSDPDSSLRGEDRIQKPWTLAPDVLPTNLEGRRVVFSRPAKKPDKVKLGVGRPTLKTEKADSSEFGAQTTPPPSSPSPGGNFHYLLHLAAAKDDPVEIERLINKEGVHADMEDAVGLCALHCAALSGSARACAALIRCGATRDKMSRSGKTALMYAAEKDHKAVMRVLVQDLRELMSVGDVGGKPVLSGTTDKEERKQLYPPSVQTASKRPPSNPAVSNSPGLNPATNSPGRLPKPEPAVAAFNTAATPPDTSPERDAVAEKEASDMLI